MSWCQPVFVTRPVRFLTRYVAFRRLDPHVLDRVGGDLGSNQRFHGVQQALVAQQGEDRGAKVVLGVRGQQGGVDGNGDVERLRVHQAGLARHRDVALLEGQLGVGAGDLAVAKHPLGFPVENLGVFVHDRLQVLVRGQDSARDDVAVAIKVGQFLGCEVHSGMSGSKFLEV